MATSSLSEQEINSFILAISPDKKSDIAIQIAERDRCMILLHLSTGVRVSELVQAKITSFRPYEADSMLYRFISKG
jgi:site-specific recombinase XerD